MGDVLPGDTLHSGRKRLTPVDNGGRIRAYSGVGRAEGDAAVHHCTLVSSPAVASAREGEGRAGAPSAARAPP